MSGVAVEKDTQPVAIQATSMMCVVCFDVLICEFQKTAEDIYQDPRTILPPNTSPTIECPLFVTWEKCQGEQYELRGCIGTLAPRRLVPALGEYASLSAFHDRRFRPISPAEAPHLRVSVSLLVNYEECSNWKDWIVGVHGIVLSFRGEGPQRFSATYLPEVAQQQRWDHHQAITSLIRKSGFKGIIDVELLERLRVTRYQSSKAKMTFAEYAQLCEKNGRSLGPIQTLHGGSTSSSCVIL